MQLTTRDIGWESPKASNDVQHFGRNIRSCRIFFGERELMEGAVEGEEEETRLLLMF